MSKLDKSLALTEYSGINYDNILRDIITIIQNDPDFSDNWEDFTSSDAGRMIMELYAFIGDALATRLDWYINEGYLPTASQRQSVIKLLKLIGYKMSLPVSSHVDVYTTPKSKIGISTLTQYVKKYNNPSFYPFSLTATGLNGETLNFELLKFNPDSQTFSYHEDVEYKNSTEYLTFWEGSTIIEDFIVTTTNNQVFSLTYPNVTKNSIQAFKVTQDGDIVNEHPLTQVTSFLSKEAQRKTDDSFSDKTKEDYDIDIPYMYNVSENQVTIEFAPISLIPSSNKRPSIGDKIRVFYRTGGGKNTNIIKKAINTTVTVESDLTQEVTQIKLVNPKAATGGEDEESTEHAKEYAPLTVRAQERTVNEEDYVTIGGGYDKIYKMKTYGAKNLNADEVYDRYGEFLKPLEAWNYILCKNNGYQNLKNNEYNEFRWITQRFENRFNEPYAFRKGKFNYELYSPEINNTDYYKNFITFRLPDEFSDYLNLNISKTKTDNSKRHFEKTENLFGDDIIKITGAETITHIEREFTPIRTSAILTNNPFQNKYISFAVDNNPITVGMENLTGSPSYPDEIAGRINEAFTSTFLNGRYPSKIIFKTVIDPNASSTNSDETNGDALKFDIRLKINNEYTETKTVIINLNEYNTFQDAMKTILSDTFELDLNRITVNVDQAPEEGGLFTTDITIQNYGYDSSCVNFIEILKYPEKFTELSPVEDELYGGGNYSSVAVTSGSKVSVISPNSGKYAKLTFFKNRNENFVTDKFFNISALFKDEFVYGSNTITYDEEENLFIFENGYFDFVTEILNEEIINGPLIYVNYILSNDTDIKFGNYAADNFLVEDPQYREPATRIYNTIYTDTDINYPESNQIVKFCAEKQDIISLFGDIKEFTYTDENEQEKTLTQMQSPYVTIEDHTGESKKLIIGVDVAKISYNTTAEDDIENFLSNDLNIEIDLSRIIGIDTLVDTINIELANKFRTIKPPMFSSFGYAEFKNGHIIVTTPTRDANSNVCYIIKDNNQSSDDEAPVISKPDKTKEDYAITEEYKSISDVYVSGNSIYFEEYNMTGVVKIGDRVVFDGNEYLTVNDITDVEPTISNGFKHKKLTILAAHNENYNLQQVINDYGGVNILYFTDDILHLQKISDNFPDLNIYANYIADKRYIKNVYEKFYEDTEEDELKNYFDKYKIISIENVFKQPIINTFDVSGTIYFNPRLYTEDFVRNTVEDALRKEFCLDNMDFGESIKKSKIFSTIQNLNCVRWSDVTTIKRSMKEATEADNSINEIKCYFDEILIISDNYKDENGVNHGIMFNYATEN